jgi:hypothetical protein
MRTQTRTKNKATPQELVEPKNLLPALPWWIAPNDALVSGALVLFKARHCG